MKIRIGSRGSKLAVAQAKWTGEEIKRRHPDCDLSYILIKTTGDDKSRSSLSEIGGKGVFVKEIEEALLRKEIDLAVHSLKDVPQILPDGLLLGPCPKREDPRDAWVSRFGELLRELPKRSTIGTGSPRRSSQIREKFKNRFEIQPVRGNVETRLKKVRQGEIDGVIVAAAGLKRLGLESEITEILEPDVMLPAPGQGCLGLEIREEDGALLTVLESIKEVESDAVARAERAFLQGLGGSCLLPVAAHARHLKGKIELRAVVFSPDGEKNVVVNEEGSLGEPELLGSSAAEKILHDGASEILLSL